MISFCTSCKAVSNFSLAGAYTVDQEDEPPFEYALARCASCSGPAVYLRQDFSEGHGHYAYKKVLPTADRYLKFPLPPIVESSYQEASRCEQAKAWTACAVMVGRCLEAVCKSYDPSMKTLFGALKTMLQNGIISQELHDWATQLRVLRNTGAHASEISVEQVDAVESFDFLEAILETLFHLRPKFEQMKARHDLAQRTTSSPQAASTP